MSEVWKDIKGFEGHYQVSDLGNIKSLSRIVFNHGINPFNSKEKILKPAISTNGKYIVGLRINNKPKSFQVHVLVAIAFHNHVPDGHNIVVDHINNNPLDNRAVNLQLTTQRHNASKDVKEGSSKYVGVSWVKKIEKWYASIQINGKTKNLGYYENEYDAHFKYISDSKSKLRKILERFPFLIRKLKSS